MKDRLFYPPLLLGLIALATSASLVLANAATRERIALAERRDLQDSLGQVLPPGHADNELLADAVEIAGADGKAVTVYRARKGRNVTGAVFRTSARGYAGEIDVVIGVGTDGRLLGARVVRHQETPGLGDKIEVARSKWILGFDGKSLGDPPAEKWGVKKDGGVFDQFAGATITPRAVVRAVKEGLEFFAAHRAEILAEGGAS